MLIKQRDNIGNLLLTSHLKPFQLDSLDFIEFLAAGKKDRKSTIKALILLNIDIQNLSINQHGKNHCNC
jgi:hypothetical protein